MLCKAHYEKMLSKLKRFEETINPYLFEIIESVPVSAFVADKQYHSIPDEELFENITSGWEWGGEGRYCWMKSEFTVPESLDGRDIFVMPHMGGYEAMLWVNGVPFGTFNTKIVYTSHGNHYCGLIKKNAAAGEKINIAIEYYAGHDYHGCDPFSEETRDYKYSFESLDVCVKNDEICKFYFDLKTVNQLAEYLPDSSFFKARAINALTEVHKLLFYSPDDTSPENFIGAIRAAQPYLTEILSEKNGVNAPEVGVIGHSHMDTAWLWHIGETVKKCARTYSNQISLMEQYPEYKFVQSSSCHSDMILKNYPDLFERIKEKVTEGRYEPNGAVWVECDCNITSGEAMVRQFLWGQRFTRKHFGYTSDCFWLPDTFGYSAAIPQIMKGCGVDYFLTTKITWNDTNRFPYDTFYWQGIDGTKVFAHFNLTHTWPDPKTQLEAVYTDKNAGGQAGVSNKRLSAFGYGDGGGGPQFEMIEMGRRCADLNEIPKAKSVTVSDFMRDLEETAADPNVYSGELYLELHRGTLTNQHEIKRNNRKAELKLRDLEILTVNECVQKGEICSPDKTNALYETLLINQFHDILPGTCINAAHKQCKAEMGEMIRKADGCIAELSKGTGDGISVTNTLSFERHDAIFADDFGENISGYPQQRYTDINGNKKLIIGGIDIGAYSSVHLEITDDAFAVDSPFEYDGDNLTTPFANIKFNENGFISSFVDTKANRELVDGLLFNTFLMAEDVPSSWDNWDIDADIELKFKECGALLSREVVSNGAVAFIIRSKYQISEKSSITQDMIFFADSPEVRFDTYMDWQDNHRFLKTAFDTSVREDFVRQEIQFGNCKRPTTRNNTLEQAKFEVVNHKYTDLSEPNYGIAILNDCKYGISAKGSSLRLSLHKGGNRPDIEGDRGYHHCVYSFMPHNCGYSAEAVARPAYELNIPHIVSQGKFDILQLVKVNAPNIIVEAIKPCEDADKAFIVRLYEAEGTFTNCEIKFADKVKKFELTNMLEEKTGDTVLGNEFKTQFRPFEIKTIKAYY
ncbi:MAG: alpha-mannosidase [Eubacterium sp.]|nr:alpha-mannosidase [Eubacterium sp.]